MALTGGGGGNPSLFVATPELRPLAFPPFCSPQVFSAVSASLSYYGVSLAHSLYLQELSTSGWDVGQFLAIKLNVLCFLSPSEQEPSCVGGREYFHIYISLTQPVGFLLGDSCGLKL